MKIKNLLALTIVFTMFTSCKDKIDDVGMKEMAKEAYIYAFPAVEHNKVIWSTVVENNLPFNYFFGNTELFTHENTAVVTPNNDTYYSYAICDIRNEPVVVSIPLIENRYFSFQICDIFTNCPDYISTLATGEGPGSYMIARSDWEGTAPAGVDKTIRVPATVVFILARTQVFGPEDKQAGVIAKSYKAAPLSKFAGTTPPSGDALKWTQPFFDAKTGNNESFFSVFNYMVQYQILNSTDEALMKKFEAIGLGAGKDFKKSQFKSKEWEAIEAGANEGKSIIQSRLNSIGNDVNNWNFSPKISGRWGTDYLTRAAAAWKYIYVNIPEEAVYATINADGGGQTLNGANKYTLTFTKEQIPKVRFFWSLTMYNAKGFLVNNPANRYNIKNIDELIFEEDGSLKLFIQKESPGAPYESNWLPAEEGQFYMVLRMYGPSSEAVEGTYVIPAVVKANKAI